MRRRISRRGTLIVIGLLSLVPYGYALQLQDLRKHTVEFEFAYFAAFGLYALAIAVALRSAGAASSPPDQAPPEKSEGLRSELLLIFIFAIVFRALLLFTPPTLSDDMYRYVWDGRVQANSLSPYAYPPSADQVRTLRDDTIWPLINRKDVVTVYPAGAELAYAVIWRIWPDNVRWFQIVMTAGDLVAGLVLLALLRAVGRPLGLVLIYLWCPLLVFETAHSAHVDGLVLPLLVAAWLARVKGRDGWTGLLLGAATAIKIYPIILFPILWRPWARREDGYSRPIWSMPLAFVSVIALAYLPYLAQGTGVLGYLPNYFNETFNMGLAGLIFRALEQWTGSISEAPRIANLVLLITLAVISLVSLVRPVQTAEQALRRCIWPIGAFTLCTQNLFPWYLLWLLPLVALFVRPGRFGFKPDAWTGWFFFGGLVALAYTFFIVWKPVEWVPWVEFGPLYAFLVLPYVKQVLSKRSVGVGAMRSPVAEDAKG